MVDLQTVLLSMGGSVVVVGAAAAALFRVFLTRIKESIRHEYEIRRLEMKAELDGTLEGTKAGYKQALDENQIRFSRLHADQADAINAVYQHLVRVCFALKAMVDPLRALPEDPTARKEFHARQCEEVKATFNECSTVFEQKRIFMPETVCDQVQDVLRTGKSAILDFTAYDDLPEPVMEGSAQSEKLRGHLAAIEGVRTMLVTIRQELERRFREILGVTPEPAEDQSQE